MYAYRPLQDQLQLPSEAACSGSHVQRPIGRERTPAPNVTVLRSELNSICQEEPGGEGKGGEGRVCRPLSRLCRKLLTGCSGCRRQLSELIPEQEPAWHVMHACLGESRHIDGESAVLHSAAHQALPAGCWRHWDVMPLSTGHSSGHIGGAAGIDGGGGPAQHARVEGPAGRTHETLNP